MELSSYNIETSEKVRIRTSYPKCRSLRSLAKFAFGELRLLANVREYLAVILVARKARDIVYRRRCAKFSFVKKIQKGVLALLIFKIITMTEQNLSKPWYKKGWVIILFALFGLAIIGLLSEVKDYSKDVGKTFCNATNNICDGVITKVQPCTTDKNQQCYVVDRGPNYSRPSEHPISNGYAK